MGLKNNVPRIPWDKISKGREINASGDFVWFRGSMSTNGTRKRQPVCIKTGLWDYGATTEDMMHEAEVLLKLKSVTNVPHLYGITETTPIALVMGFCPGSPLKQLQKSAKARSYLAAIREACVVLGRVHHKGIVHGSISASNILVVTRRSKEDVTVSIVRFDHAEITKDKDRLQVDADSLVTLMHTLADMLPESSPFYEHRGKLREERTVNLTDIVKILCSVMHEDRVKCKCKKLKPGN